MNKNELQIKVTVTRVLYPQIQSDNGGPQFRIFRTDRGVCKGYCAWRPTENERLALAARGNGRDGWVVSQFSGSPEFQFASMSHDEPIDERSRLEYAAALTHGMGPAMAAAIWEAKGADWRTVKAGEVRGFTPDVAAAFAETLKSCELKRERADAIALLLSLGASMRMAEVAWEKWGIQTVSIVRSDCYRLADLPNFSFVDVDRNVASRFGIRGDDQRRISACVCYCVRRLSEDGGTLVAWTALRDAVIKSIGVSQAALATCVKGLFGSHRLIPFQDATPQSLAEPRFAEAERLIANYAKEAV